MEIMHIIKIMKNNSYFFIFISLFSSHYIQLKQMVECYMVALPGGSLYPAHPSPASPYVGGDMKVRTLHICKRQYQQALLPQMIFGFSLFLTLFYFDDDNYS